jgi:hypothetical protein
MGRRAGLGERDQALLKMDRVVTIDQLQFESASGSNTNRANLARMVRWGEDFGVPAMLATSLLHLNGMPQDHRHLSWYWAHRSFQGLKFETHKRERGSVRNYYDRLPGMAGRTETEFPTNTTAMMHRFGGLEQRLGNDPTQDRVVPTRLLADLLALLEADWQRARGERALELVLVNAAVHVLFQGGFRANEPLQVSVRDLERGVVKGAERRGLPDHFWIKCPLQTKENRVSTAVVPLSYHTVEGCPLMAGVWVERGLEAVRAAGRSRKGRFFADEQGQGWKSAWLWAEHIRPRLEQLQREGAVGEEVDLCRFGSNSPRRTWDTMAQAEPDKVAEDLIERQGRWRQKQKRRNRVSVAMVRHYAEPGLKERPNATHFLSHIDE